jgi:RimJ/RimL family protein N-acetyltransferase
VEQPGSVPPILLDLPDELLGERVLVRPYRPGDGQAVWEAVDESRERLRPWLPWTDTHRTPADSEAFVRRSWGNWAVRSDLIVGVWERETGRYLGSSGIHPRDWDVRWFEVGYWLRTGAEGHGYITEAVGLLLKLAFETLHADRVDLRCDTRNTRSAAVALRLGFIHEGTQRQSCRAPGGDLRDMMIFAMTREDYARRPGTTYHSPLTCPEAS